MAKKRAKLKHGTKKTAQPSAQVSVANYPWDKGADGPANLARVSRMEGAYDAEIDPDTGEAQDCNPNAVKRLRFVDMLEQYHTRGVISDRGYDAGFKLRAAWETTQRGGGMDFSQDKVDATSKPDAQAAIKVDRVSRYVRIKRLIPQGDNALLMTVVCEGHSIASLRQYRAVNLDAGKAHLRHALDRLADAMGV